MNVTGTPVYRLLSVGRAIPKMLEMVVTPVCVTVGNGRVQSARVIICVMTVPAVRLFMTTVVAAGVVLVPKRTL